MPLKYDETDAGRDARIVRNFSVNAPGYVAQANNARAALQRLTDGEALDHLTKRKPAVKLDAASALIARLADPPAKPPKAKPEPPAAPASPAS